MTKRLLIYDLDGTLVDTAEDIGRSTNHMLRELGKAALSRDEIIRCIGQGLRQLIKGCLRTEDPSLIERGMAIYRAHYGEHLLDRTVLFPDAQRVLERFKDRQQAILTNKPNPFTTEILAGLDVAHFFSEVIAGDSGYPRKPDPAGVRALLEKSRAGREDAVLLGDSPIDVLTARNAGVLMVAVTHGFGDPAELEAAGPDRMVGSFREFMELASRERW